MTQSQICSICGNKIENTVVHREGAPLCYNCSTLPRYRLYQAYDNFLSDLLEEDYRPVGALVKEIEENREWKDIYCDGKVVGFLIIAEDFNGCDYFIQDAYIEPRYRNRGLMTDAIQKQLKEKPGSYFLFVINKNKYARNFWNNRFTEMGYKEFIPAYFEGMDKNVVSQYGYTII